VDSETDRQARPRTGELPQHRPQRTRNRSNRGILDHWDRPGTPAPRNIPRQRITVQSSS